MPYNENLVNRVREKLMHLADVEEKAMFGGLIFMVDNKMCIGVMKEKLMLRINPEKLSEIEGEDGWEQMLMSKTVMNGYILVSEDVVNRTEELNFWLNLALDFNPFAKSSARKKSKP
ncbi:MAG: TfoX family protein [Sphingobacteriales bacterium]|nr:MAG: TfoX family protein [Sphingobacteriales bacterium]